MPEKSRDNNGKSVQSIEPHQSTWFTHWTGTRYGPSAHDPSPHLTQIKEDDLDIKIASDNFRSSKGIKDMELAMSLKKTGTQSFPFFKRGQEIGRSFTLNEEKQTLGSSSRESHFQPEESSHTKYHMFFSEAVFASKNHLPKTEQEHNIPSFLRHDNLPLLKGDPSTSTTNNNNQSPSFIEEQYKRMQKHIGMGFFPNQTGNPEMMKPATVHSFQNIPHLEGLHSFSRTTHSLLITKQTDVELYQENQIFREAMVSTQRGLKLQLLDSSDQESQEKIGDVKAVESVQKNESSADTDTMDMGSFKENHFSGVHLSPRNKDITVESKLPILPLSKQKDIRRKRKIEVPDINVEISDLPASSNSTEKSEPCTSRTQSLDMNSLHFNLHDTPNSRSEECSDSTNHSSEPGNRWIKRLKLTASRKTSENKKLNKLFTKLTEEKPEPRLDQCRRKSEIQIGESSSVKEGNDITLSHSWIQRWSHNQGPKIPVGSSKPENPKSAPEEFEKKQFPSIAAMALMGKAMTGFQPCKFQKKESFVVWNTKGFE